MYAMKTQQNTPAAVTGTNYNKEHGDIRDAGILIELHMGSWKGKIFDPKLARDLANLHGVSSKNFAGLKQLVAPEIFAKINTCQSQIRQLHDKNTVPWFRRGASFLPRPLIDSHCKALREKIREHDQLVDDLIPAYERAVLDAPRLLKGSYNAADYPSASELRRRFYVLWEPSEIPSDSPDFRVRNFGVDAGELESRAMAAAESKLKAIKSEPYKRLAEKVSAMVNGLSNYNPDRDESLKGKRGKKPGDFNASLINNLIEIVDFVPQLDPFEDPKLRKFCDEIKRDLTAYDAQTLKEDELAREHVKDRAKQIEDRLSAFF